MRLPWIRWDRGTGLPDQAILIDMANGRLFFFGLEIWPQELYLVTGLLVIAALGLFLVSSVAGRVWCGYFCWQTVWTDLMVAVERLWQGDRNARIRLDKEPWGVSKIFKKTMTHISWLLISAATGGAFILYFDNAPTMFFDFFRGEAAPVTYLFFALLTGSTYLFGGLAREQVCIYMCPWPRIQGAMFDAEFAACHLSRLPWRAARRATQKQGWEGRGDCIDCKACVAVAPWASTSATAPARMHHLRAVHRRLRRNHGQGGPAPRADRLRHLPQPRIGEEGRRHETQFLRPRTLLYLGLISVVGALMFAAIGCAPCSTSTPSPTATRFTSRCQMAASATPSR